MANSQNLEKMKLPELKELAKQIGLRGTSTMRKPELMETLRAARSGGQAPAGVTVRAPQRQSAATTSEPGQPQASTTKPKTEAPESNAEGGAQPVPERQASQQRRRRAARKESGGDIALPELANDSAPKVSDSQSADTTRVRSRRSRRTVDHGTAERGNGSERNVANRGGVERGGGSHSDVHGEGDVRDLDDILASLPVQHNDEEQDGEDRELTRRSHNRDRNGRNDRSDRNGEDRRQRRLRGRDRDRDRDHEYEERDARDDRHETRREEAQDDFVPVAGIVDVLDSYAFVRTSGYLPGPNDVYVSMGQVKRYGLRKGDAVQGSIRPPHEGDRRNQRQKFVPLQSIDSVNGLSVEDAANRPQFSKLTPLYPQERLKQETAPNKITGRLIDIVAPIGKGQRGLIVSPPKAGKTITLQNIANSIAANNPEAHLMVVLVDERPEEVTDMERTVQGEVISSTFDRPASDHTTVAELAIERAKRLVELGQDVVVLLDSMTRLARAYNIAAPASGRILSGGVDAQALYPPKKFFGAARNIENGGSLTIISSALVETGSKMDEVIFEEFKGTGNMELRLSRELADKRLFPAIDVNASGTRREELITASDELPIIYRLRRLLGGLEPEQAYQTLVPRLKKTATNRDFLAAIVQQSGGASN